MENLRKNVQRIKLALVAIDDNWDCVGSPVLLDNITASNYRDAHIWWQYVFGEDLTLLLNGQGNIVKAIDDYMASK